MTDTHTPEAAIVRDLAVKAAEPYEYGDDVLIYPNGDTFDVHDMTRFADHPRRAANTVRPATADDLTNYLQRYARQAELTVWVHPTDGTIEAIIDDHMPNLNEKAEPVGGIYTPGHREHRAIVNLIVSPEWEAWASNDARTFNQTDFAEHIETNGKEIVEPSAADMLELAQSFHASSKATFRSAKRLQDGTTQMQYDEVTTASAGKSGDMVVPAEFKLAIRPFLGEPAYAVTARLRYRVSGGNLSLSYHLDRPLDVVNDCLSKIAERLGNEFDNVYVGSAR